MKNVNKKIIILLVIGALVTCIIGALIFLFTSPQSPLGPAFQPNPSPRVINPQGDTVLLETGKYRVVFLPNYNKYLISVMGTPFEVFRQEAEQAFITALGIDQTTACTFDVTVSTPRFANPSEAGKDYPLSFCGPRPSPSIAINPNLTALQFIGSNPPPGSVAMGTTRNGIFLTFAQEVDISTINISISPQLSFRQIYHPRDKKIITISPNAEWQSNTTYTITIQAGTFSLDQRAQLKQPVNLTYEVKEVVFPEDDHGEFITE